MAELREPELHVPPSDRQVRRRRDARATLLWSLLAHAAFVLLFLLFARALGFVVLPARQAPGPPRPESVTIQFNDQRVKIPEPTPPQTDVIAEDDAVARSPGEGEPTPHGETSRPDPDAGLPGRPAPEPQEPARRAEPRQDAAPAAPVETLEDKRRRVAEALGRVGSSGDLGDSGWGDHAGSPESGISFNFGGGGMQIESKSHVDWGPWARQVTEKVKGNWLAIMPVAARVGMKGIVVVRFRVHRDGSLTDFEQLETSGVPPFDQAAQDALIRMSNPLPPPPIPAESDEESIRVTFTFIYNLEDEREQRAWRRMNWQRQRAQQGG